MGDIVFDIFRGKGALGQVVDRPFRGLLHSQVQIGLFWNDGSLHLVLPRHEGSFKGGPHQS